MAYLFKYGKGKRFLLMFLVMFIPCSIPAYYFPLSDYITMLIEFPSLSFPKWSALWLASFNTSYYAWIALAVAMIVFTPILAYVTTIITRHIRIGRFTMPNLFKAVNENFFAGISVVVFSLAIIFIFHLIYTLLLYMWMQIASKIFGLILGIITFALVLLAATYVLSATLLWLPTMSFTGAYILPALSSAFYKSRNYQRYFFVPALGAVSIAVAVSVVCHFLRDIWYVKWILTSVMYTSYIVFTVTFGLISYCEAESVKREDLTNTYFGR